MRLGRSMQDIDRAERLALVGEGDLDGVVHAAAADDFDVAAVGPAAEDAGRRPSDRCRRAAAIVVAVPAVAPVEPAVGAEEGAVDVGGVAGEAELRDELARARRPRRRRRCPRAARCWAARPCTARRVPEHAHRERHLVGEHGALVEAALAVGVLQQADAVGSSLSSPSAGKFCPAAASIQNVLVTAPIIRMKHHRRLRNPLHHKPRRHLEPFHFRVVLRRAFVAARPTCQRHHHQHQRHQADTHSFIHGDHYPLGGICIPLFYANRLRKAPPPHSNTNQTFQGLAGLAKRFNRRARRER